jgi:hypothetical protein
MRKAPILWLLWSALLAGCSAPPIQITYVDLKATAAVTGCWPGNNPTPNPVVVTPNGPTPTTGGTLTPLPTTTSYPRCTPVPGAPTLIPYPTSVPTLVPYPTQKPLIVNGGDQLVTALDLPRLHHADVAVHPSEGWAAAASVWPDDEPSRRIFVRVFHPLANAWGIAKQVNPPPAEDGNGLYGGVALGITGDGTIHVAWGGGMTPGQPVWYVQSVDYGVTWSPPQQIGSGCYRVESVGTTLDGQVVVLASCSDAGGGDAQPGVFHRRTNSIWSPFVKFPVDGQHSSLVIVGDGNTARAVVLATNVHNQGQAWIIQKRLDDSGPWQIQAKDLTPPSGLYSRTASYYLFRGTSFHRPNGADGIIFTWSLYGGNAIHAVVSLDGGQSWGPIETVVAYRRAADADDRPPDHRWSAPAYDVRSDRLIVFLVRRDLDVPWPGNGTHYAFWSVPGSGEWIPRQGPDLFEQAIPLVSGATSASWTDTAQMGNSSFVWLAWVNRWKQLQVRSLDLDLIVPPDQYPLPTPTAGAGS